MLGALPLKPLLICGGLAATVLTYGWPHLLWEYTESRSWCRYIALPGVSEGFETSGHCPLIQWRK